MILDATAGKRMMWFNKNNPDAIFFDEKREVKPDIIGDFRYLPFPDETFVVDVFDPPHMVYSVKGKPSFLEENYGLLRPETWQSDLKKAFKELWRVLKVNGVLIFKWNDNHISGKKVLGLFSVKALFGQVTGGSRGFKTKKKKHPRSNTSWFCFLKTREMSFE